ncbi:NAD-binding protein [Pisolithus orientalis]|uniref:NAD-binding protein n=1 Tax=Pisolithus orientalis TaxID=936130 RepID=UPI002224BC13|nr:NAD-binding protein [Pisolithus orientalis]KAI5986431.1 NAD-binding protein [Pisolithus orientalis]
MSLLILSAQDVDTITVALPSAELEALMASVFHCLSLGSHYASPQRTSITMSHHTALFMPSWVEDIRTAIKVVSVPTSANNKHGLPASTILLDKESRHVEVIVNVSALTALRTAAATLRHLIGSVLATCLLLSELPSLLVTLSTGKQIEAHVDLHIHAFLSLKQCTIVNCSMRLALDDMTSIQSAIGHVNVICMETSSTQPLFPSEWVLPGTHLNLMGSFKLSMVKVDYGLISQAEMIIVDSIEAGVIEAGELIAASLNAGDMVGIGWLVEKWDCKDGLEEIQMRKGDVMVFKLHIV